MIQVSKRFDDSRTQQLRMYFAKSSPPLNIFRHSTSYLTVLPFCRGDPTRAQIAKFFIVMCGVDPDQSQLRFTVDGMSK